MSYDRIFKLASKFNLYISGFGIVKRILEDIIFVIDSREEKDLFILKNKMERLFSISNELDIKDKDLLSLISDFDLKNWFENFDPKNPNKEDFELFSILRNEILSLLKKLFY